MTSRMAPRKSKAKTQVKEVADLAKGWKRCKMTESELLELENNKILQSRAVIQWRAVEEEDHPYEGTHEVVFFAILWSAVLLFPFLSSFNLFCDFGGSNCII